MYIDSLALTCGFNRPDAVGCGRAGIRQRVARCDGGKIFPILDQIKTICSLLHPEDSRIRAGTQRTVFRLLAHPLNAGIGVDGLTQSLLLLRMVNHKLVAVSDGLRQEEGAGLSQKNAAAIAQIVFVLVDVAKRRDGFGFGAAAQGAAVVRAPGLCAGGVGLCDLLPSVVTASGARGSHPLRYRSAKEQEGQLRIVDKDVAVALDALNCIVAAHLPGINRIVFDPIEQYVQALDHVCAVVFLVVMVHGRDLIAGNGRIEIGLTPTDVDVQQNPRRVALDPVGRFIIRGVGVARGRAKLVCHSFAAQHDAIGLVTVDVLVDHRTGRAKVMAVRAAVDLEKGCLTFRPDVLAVEIRAVPLCNPPAPDIIHRAVAESGNAVGIDVVGGQRAVAIVFLLRVGHEGIERVEQLVVLAGGIGGRRVGCARHRFEL